MLQEHKVLKLSNTAFEISEWNPTFPDGTGRSYGSPNLPPCASPLSLPCSLSLCLTPFLSLGWYFLDICSWQAQQQSQNCTRSLEDREGCRHGGWREGREGRKDGGRTENKRVKRIEEEEKKNSPHTKPHSSENSERQQYGSGQAGFQRVCKR